VKFKFSNHILLLCSFSFIIVASQGNRPGKEELYYEHRQALALYNAATEFSGSANYDEAREKELNQKALDQFSLLLKKIPENNSDFDSLRFHSSFTIGELHHYFENYAEALTYYAKALEIKNKSALPDSLLMRPYIYSGLIYYQQNRINTAALFFNRADSIQQKYTRPLRESERLYNTLGVIHYETGNFRLAKFYFQKALDLLPASSPYYIALFANYKINLAQIHFTLQEYEEANKIYKELLAYNINHNEIYLNLGIINLNLGANEKALSYFRKVERVNNPKRIRLFNQMGKAYLNLNQFDSARHYVNMALALGENGLADPSGYGSSVKTMGDLYLKLDSPSKAIQSYSDALTYFYPSYQNKNVEANPEVFSGVFSFTNLFSSLVGKAEAANALYRKTKDVSWAKEELEIYQSAFKLVGYVEKTYNSDEARLFINHYKYEVHGKPIDIAFELYQKTGDKKFIRDLYFIDQQNKASVLALNQVQSAYRSGGDTSILRQEREIKASITRNLLKASRTRDSIQLAGYSKEIREQEILLDRIQSKLSTRGASNRIPSIEGLQEVLDGSTALVSFHLSEEKITIINIRSKQLEAVQVDHGEGFQDKVQSYIHSLRDPSSQPAGSIAKELQRSLFGKLDLAGINRLIIIPDDELNFLPFETLVDEDGKYLFEKFSIQYQYSTAVLKKQKDGFKNDESLAFAPFALNAYQKDSVHFPQLPNSLNEVEEIDGEKFIGQTATRANFLHQVGNYSTVHLATHAVAGEGPGNSYIVFAGNRNDSDLLFSEEIYNLELKNTRLVILSACETGAGKLERGEGVMSLSRAFTYAGCPNILTSLWKADDMSTAYLTKRVHFYLDKDYSIDRAMQLARMDFFRDPKIHPSYRHPYYWGHLVFIGNYEPGKNHALLWISGGLILSLALGLFFINHKGKKTKGKELSFPGK
jgi:CHAT domain-containing protein